MRATMLAQATNKGKSAVDRLQGLLASACLLPLAGARPLPS
jgi:hypothetical protein